VLEVGGTHVSAAAVDPVTWHVSQQCRTPLDSSADAEAIIATLVRAGAALDVPEGSAWGVAMPDPFDYANGIATFRDVGKFDALYGLDVGAALRTRLPQRPAMMVFRNDADAFVLGEWRLGAAEGFSRCVGITLGTGLGTGWLVDGAVVVDEPGIPELGRARFLSVDGDGLEEVVSRRGIRRAYRVAGGDDADVREIAERARSGERRAATTLDRIFDALGRGIGPSLRAFGAEVVVIGGSIAGSWAQFNAAFRRGLDWPDGPPVVLARHPEDAALRGAATTLSPR
jgi:glucokinase